MSKIFGFTALAMLVSGPVVAAPLSFQDILQQFNLVVLGDATSDSEVEGRSYVAGNLSGTSNYWIGGSHAPQAPSDYATLTVGGNLTGPVQVNRGGNVVVGGDATGVDLNGGGSATIGGVATQVQGGPVTSGAAVSPGFSDLFPTSIAQTVKDSSLSFGSLSGTAAPITGNTAYFGAGMAGLTVYDMTLAQVSSLGQVDFSRLGAGESILINVTGTGTGSFLANPLGGTGAAEHVLWNFVDATDLTLHGIVGSVLAPLTHVIVANPVEGALIAGTATLDSEVHLRPTEGNFTPPEPPPAPVPLPAALPLLLAGMGAMGLTARRRR
ncbi:hypothetical protein CG51_04140 [Haematobacter missouriensis]|uniref:VPLPA-CTERM sorting domain-containing protein n=1 Tax=Haematobacter missouriensis TaxID=366616 RepID=A0A212AX54_9RHOB|nr:collagen-binding domain-containing protein [Haematobacter missouriensis]KFI34279.1 hypothetical protein CG51_04140 [Haematobacter missouriensis]OWJ78299.1 VPLPA-CTERM sorting domain-containing protein [Haematobacter missouriensis]OWJ86048.1 VPLPA-CTERM sorting domain-containing protein [Haematobacter missouriensis]